MFESRDSRVHSLNESSSHERERSQRCRGDSTTIPWRRLAPLAMVLGFLAGAVEPALAQNGRSARSFPNQVPILQTSSVDPQAAEASQPDAGDASWPATLNVDQMLSPNGLSSTLKIMVLLTILSLAPSILIMTTCFIRFVIVIGLLRQALGTQQLPPNQVIVSLCLFLTLLVMSPVWKRAYEEGIKPYTQPAPGQPAPDLKTAFERTSQPIRQFMIEQIERTGNQDAVLMFLDYQRPDPQTPQGQAYREPEYWDEIPLSVLLPAYMLSELKTAFVIGFQLYLPFVIIDMVLSSVLISMGMLMLPPVLISLPFKILLFVLINGWYLTVGMLLDSVQSLG